MSELAQIHFHLRCKKMKLTHITFADDLILCCKGEFTSIYLMMQAFKLFSDTSGLQGNVQKSAIYTCGMAEEEVQRTLSASGFIKSNLPFKYMGVPICAKTISRTSHNH